MTDRAQERGAKGEVKACNQTCVGEREREVGVDVQKAFVLKGKGRGRAAKTNFFLPLLFISSGQATCLSPA